MSHFQDNYNVLQIASMFSREDVVKLLLNKRGVDAYSTGGVSILHLFSLLLNMHVCALNLIIRKVRDCFFRSFLRWFTSQERKGIISKVK